MLRAIGDQPDERLLLGPDAFDDAGVVVLGSGEGLPAGVEVALVQTVDFFPPVVDDPWFYGAIAAANSLSDVYAMGGRAVSALSLAGFPPEFPDEWIGAIFDGAMTKMREAGAVVVGGHTVDSVALFGFSVTGVVDRANLTANGGARPGDVAYLTKSLGMGGMTTAAKLGKIDWETLRPAAEQMAALNSTAAEAMNAAGVHACTDITGFGLTGHARNIAAASGTTMRIRTSEVPLFGDALEMSRKGWLSGGSKRGRAAIGDDVKIGAGIDEALINLLFDAETSGGLFILVPEDHATALESELARRSLPVVCIAECIERTDALIELV